MKHRSKEPEADRVRKLRENRHNRRRLLAVLSLFVALGTISLLMLPATTLERIPTCGLEEHVHDRSCYLQCGREESELVMDGTPELACPFISHVHSPTCYEGEKLVCGYSEVYFHTHAAGCFGENGEQICPLTETPRHEHTDECRVLELNCTIPEGHIHNDACFREVVVCGLGGETGHIHTLSCIRREQVCSWPENHIHTDACYVNRYGCGFDEDLNHVHTAVCFDEAGHAVCGKCQYLSHVHTEQCFANVLSGHVHSDACYSNVPKCGRQEHVHTDACFQKAPQQQDKDRLAETAPATADEFNDEEMQRENSSAENNAATAEEAATTGEASGMHKDADDIPASLLTATGEEATASEGEAMPEQAATEDEAEVEEYATMDEATPGESVPYEDATMDEAAEAATMDEATPDEPAKRVLKYQDENYSVSVYLEEESSLPENAVLKVMELKDGERYEACVESIRAELGSISGAQLLDISILSDGEKVEPDSRVRVQIQSFYRLEGKRQIIHFMDEEEKEKDEAAISEAEEATPSEPVPLAKSKLRLVSRAAVESNQEAKQLPRFERMNASEDGEIMTFETGHFSVYGIVYTVDFEIEHDGKVYSFSIPGGGSVTLGQIAEVLGLTDSPEDTKKGENGSDVEEHIEASLQNDEAPSEEQNTEAELSSGDGLSEAVPADICTVQVSEKTRQFLKSVVSVEFSDPSLVWVGKTAETATVGQIKEENGLEIQYSSGLNEEQIEQINAQTVETGDWALISLRPFSSEESLTVTMANGDAFIIKVTDGQIKTSFMDAQGDTWQIVVTYDESAMIPEGASLKVEEILPENENFAEYYRQSLEKLNAAIGEDDAASAEPEDDAAENSVEDSFQDASESDGMAGSYVHIFNIEIWADGQKIEPASDVSVSMKLLDAPTDGNSDLKVVHFGKDGLEVMETETANETKDGVAELIFVTNEFSVYSVVNVNNSTDLVNGGPWALVTGIANDPGASTGYSETWGRDYFTIIVNANAMSDAPVKYQDNEVAYEAEGVRAWTDGENSYVGGEAPQVWYFERVPNSDRYYIYVKKNDTKYYIDHHYGTQATTSLSTQWKTEFTIERNSDGTIFIYNNGWYLCNNGNGEWGSRDFRFSNAGNIRETAAAKFRLCKKSNEFDSFAARKVSASLIEANVNYIIYRKFEDEQGNEALYALAHDGTFVRVYDGGDTIYWREMDKNIYWNYQLENSYPVLFTENLQTQERVYINPNHSTGQTLSSTSNGLTLLGKDNGEYGTPIECWDQAAYDYAGLHVTQNGDGSATLLTGTRVAGTSDEFLFAMADAMPGGTAETVETVDSDSLGIKITMFDYGDWNGNYHAGDKLSEMTAIAGSAEYTPHAAHELVKPYLESGLPSSRTAGAMTGLFSSGGAIKSSKSGVNHLFLQSYYDESGTFRYRSEDNYAYLPFSNGQITGTDFIVYRQAATPYTTDTQPGHTYYYHGHFMPYNDIDMTQSVGRLMNQYGNAYDPVTGEIVGEIPIGDGRTYEEVYGVQGIPNFYTGMKMEAKFTQPRNGKLDKNGDDMIFKFTGDDDMWVYIDGILVLDIGGIHEPLSGTINFATGVVTNPVGSSLAGTTTLKQIFMNVRDAAGTPQEVKDKINSIVWDGDTFADYTNHDFKAFYMERGAGASNLDIQFNLKVTLTNEFMVEKEIPDGVDDRFANQTYKFQATYMADSTEKPLYAGIKNVCTAVVYKDTNDPVTIDENGYFYLKAGEAAVFKMADESIRYNVKEVEIDGDLIEQVDINGQQVTVTNGTAEAGYAMVEDRTQVTVMNHPKTQNLLITKHLTEDSAPLVEGENPVFEFRVYLETTVTNENGTTQQQLVPYSYAPYYLVKEVDGETHYFTLTGVNNAPVDKGTTKTVCSTTGRSGSINSIPPEYTIIIPDLVDGTNFYVEERRDNIPEGYEFVREELKEGTYEENNLGTTQEIISRIIARDETDHQDFDPYTVGRIKQGVDAESHIYNRKPAVIITVEKEWDPDPEDGTTVTVELRRYAKVTKGTISVTLYDNNEAPIEGAVFELYKDGEATGTEVATNVNGIASISDLEAGTYKLVQKSTPEGYSMENHTTKTGTLTVVDNVTAPQTLSESLTNTALVTAGKVTLTLTDSGAGSGTAGDPIKGATYTIYKDGAVYSTGHQTNSEGKVVIGNLGAGEYYLVQTATTADYNLPNVTRTESFTVVENPGATQEFTRSMTNSLKGKGTVSLTLRKDSGEAISGASFQLKSGNTVLETASTGSDGTLSFSTELYEGTYSVHQVNTGSAGDDYAVADDQTVTIDANSVTTQPIELTFVNEEAAGNVTITMWKGDKGQYNQAKINPDITSLKAGVEYTFRIGGMPANNVENGDTIQYTTSFIPGQAPSSNSLVTILKSAWVKNEGTYYYDIKYTPQQDDTNYVFGIVSSWGLKDANISFTLVENSRSSAPSSMKAMSMRAAQTSFQRSNVRSQTVTHTDASPASAPVDYADDSTFEAIEITLPTADGWQYTFPVQDKYDADGNPYYYYIVETNCSDPDYWIDSYTGGTDGLLNDVGTLKVKNVKEKTGSIQVTKSFSGVDTLPTGFQITNNYNNSETFTVENASGSGTSEDPYVWTLSGVPAGTMVTFTESGATVNGYNLTVTSSGTVVANSQVSATVVAGETATAGLINTYEEKTTEVTLKKVDKDHVQDANPPLLYGAAFTISKYPSQGAPGKDTSWGDNGSMTIRDEKKQGEAGYTKEGVFTFEGLTQGYYIIDEIVFPAGYVQRAGNPSFQITPDASNKLVLTIVNNPDNLLRLVNGEFTIIVGNTPGSALPNTGGPGTNMLYFFGIMLVGLAGTGLVMKRRRRKNVA